MLARTTWSCGADDAHTTASPGERDRLPIRALLRVRVAVPSQRYRAAIRIGMPPLG
jgi:hypothetical protein